MGEQQQVYLGGATVAMGGTERAFERLQQALCIVFDVDDTLYLERDYVFSGMRAIGLWAHEHLGIHGLGEVSWQLFQDGVRGHIFDVALTRIGSQATPWLVRSLVEVYRHHSPEIQLAADARRCLDVLVPHTQLGVITDGPVPCQRAKIDALGLSRWITWSLLTGEQGVGYGKPDPRVFELLARKARVPGSACVYLADNPHKDFQAPHALGWTTVRVRRPWSLHFDAPSGADVDTEIQDLSEVVAVFERIEPACPSGGVPG